MQTKYVEILRPNGLQWRHFGSVSSTMDEARVLIDTRKDASADWCGLVTADHQYQGRGRQGRSWESVQESWMGTFVIPTSKPIGELVGYSLGIGVAVARACEELGCKLSLKWPNDLVVELDKGLAKVGGVLIEIEERAGTRFILVGLGLNIAGIPSSLRQQAASLGDLAGQKLSLGAVSERLVTNLMKVSRGFLQQDSFGSLRQEWEERTCFQQGRTKLSICVADKILEGSYEGLTESGALRLQTDECEHQIHSGHIESITL